MIIRRARYVELVARVDAYAEAARESHRVERAALDNSGRIAEKFTALDDSAIALEDRLARVLRACLGYRAELARRGRRIRHLEARLDNLLGLDAPAVAAGAQWQDRRPDIRKENQRGA